MKFKNIYRKSKLRRTIARWLSLLIFFLLLPGVFAQKRRSMLNNRVFLFILLFIIGALTAFSQNAATTHAGCPQGYMDATGSSAKFKAPTNICIR
ncbi:MAG TPA: hypothetical protein VNY73_10985 [Bacteroidia bacterium]|jgi:hypothetical protein|nr:hypothetical protein [Bacteroidia bacterium]